MSDMEFTTKTDDKNKLCPLCGGPTQTNVWTYKGKNAEQRCFCLNENCSLSKRTYEISEWNTRPLEDALRSRVEELERERKQIADNLSDPDDIVVIANNLRTMRLLSDNANLQAELTRLREQVRWRNYPEEKPNKPGDYWCEIASAVDVGKIYKDALNYNDGWGTFARVFRWTFLPIPPEVK